MQQAWSGKKSSVRTSAKAKGKFVREGVLFCLAWPSYCSLQPLQELHHFVVWRYWFWLNNSVYGLKLITEVSPKLLGFPGAGHSSESWPLGESSLGAWASISTDTGKGPQGNGPLAEGRKLPWHSACSQSSYTGKWGWVFHAHNKASEERLELNQCQERAAQFGSLADLQCSVSCRCIVGSSCTKHHIFSEAFGENNHCLCHQLPGRFQFLVLKPLNYILYFLW